MQMYLSHDVTSSIRISKSVLNGTMSAFHMEIIVMLNGKVFQQNNNVIKCAFEYSFVDACVEQHSTN